MSAFSFMFRSHISNNAIISLLYVTYNNVTKCVWNDGSKQGWDKSSFLEMDSNKGRPLFSRLPRLPVPHCLRVKSCTSLNKLRTKVHYVYDFTGSKTLNGFYKCILYNGNRPRKKSFANCLLCCSLRENFHDSGNLIYKNSGQDKKCKKTFVNASRFVKLFFSGWFPLYGMWLDLGKAATYTQG